MAITLVGTNSGSAGNGNDVTVSIPGGTVQDDIVLVMGGHGNTAGDAGVNSAGYTEVIDRDRGACQLSVSWRRMPSSVPSSVDCKGSGNAADAAAYVVMVFRGVDTSTAIDVTSTSDESTGNTPNSPLITTVTDGAAVISCFIQASNETSLTQPSGYVNKIQESKTETSPVTVAAAWDAISPAGGENPGPWTGLPSAAWVAATIALRPAAAGVVEDSVFSATGTVTPSWVGAVSAGAIGSGFFTMTGGSNTAIWVGQSLGITGALSVTGTGTASFQGEGGGLGSFAMSHTVTVSWVGGKEYMSSVREVIESRGAATVNVA
jgi:hypothetical protein